MISLKGFAAGLVALLSADAVIASPCKVSLSTTSTHALSSSVPIYTESTSSSVTVDLTTTTVETTSGTETPSTAVETTETTIKSSDVPSTTESAATTEASTSADVTSADATTTTEAISTSTEIASTTEQLPPVLPTIANAGFDDNSNGSPWMSTSQVSSGAVYWKRSQPNIMVIRPGRYIAQEITGLRTNLTYRIRFYWVKFDTPSGTAGCKVIASFGGSNLGEVALLPPRTPNNVFEEFYSTPFQPPTTSAELRIQVTCLSAGQTNRFYVDDVSIEFA